MAGGQTNLPDCTFDEETNKLVELLLDKQCILVDWAIDEIVKRAKELSANESHLRLLCGVVVGNEDFYDEEISVRFRNLLKKLNEEVPNFPEFDHFAY